MKSPKYSLPLFLRTPVLCTINFMNKTHYNISLFLTILKHARKICELSILRTKIHIALRVRKIEASLYWEAFETV